MEQPTVTVREKKKEGVLQNVKGGTTTKKKTSKQTTD